ncbi:hypothetical protein PLICRDRAFT_50779 [Plicaturopsis crispa FD-325 SS-3]|nr:hypothetical protein PLICRDRAFT_50779 [Plicaturopsis crispa FD-325 SS-3]
MSFLVGPVSGALVAGGVYYGFSNLIATRTAQHQSDLHSLSVRLVDAPTYIPAPLPAAARITHHPFLSVFQDRWNAEIETLFRGFGSWDLRAQEWGKKLLYGSETSQSQKQS